MQPAARQLPRQDTEIVGAEVSRRAPQATSKAIPILMPLKGGHDGGSWPGPLLLRHANSEAIRGTPDTSLTSSIRRRGPEAEVAPARRTIPARPKPGGIAWIWSCRGAYFARSYTLSF